MSNQPRTTTPGSGVDLKACLHAAWAPLLTWTVPVVGATLSGQPGVACMTPMAWLLAFWCGMRYVEVAGGRPGSSLAGPAAAGALLGAGFGALLVVVVLAAMSARIRPDEVTRTWILMLVLVAAGLVVCSGLAVLGAGMFRRRLAAEGR